MKISSTPMLRRSVKTVPITVENNKFRRHEIFGEWSTDEEEARNFGPPGDVWSGDLDPSLARSYRVSERFRSNTEPSGYHRSVEVISEESPGTDGERRPVAVTWLMESEPEITPQFSYFSHSEWKDGKPVSLTRQRINEGVMVWKETVVPDYDRGTLTTISLLNTVEGK